ncbi:MAG: plasmid mobilization relaxosome protein MobC, partial [Acidobacteria bacterium]|nr:plasmid mobilization relaxosome protein MobC [Acidobacteriota bacterium]
GNNLNQIARWANTHASPMDAIEMIAYLVHIARTLDKLARVGREADGAR